MYEYIGALHIHSTYSDGTGKADEIAGFADEVGLDYIILTDHNTLRARDDGFEAYHGNTLMLVGCEINDKENKNHYLSMRIDKTLSTRIPASEYVKKVKEMGGIGFIAHPHEKRNTYEDHPPYPWTEWDTDDFTGLEIWNHMSEWAETLNNENKFNHFIHPLKTIQRPPQETLNKWDEIALRRKVIGIGGVDAHAHKINFLGFVDFEIFPYKVLFKAVRTHVLCEKKLTKKNTRLGIENDKSEIYSALENGRCFVANAYHGDARGFRFYAEASSGIYQMGDTIDMEEKIRLKVNLPNTRATIRLIHNSKIIGETENFEAQFPIDAKGVYRIEVYLQDKAWIFSNHIRIGV